MDIKYAFVPTKIISIDTTTVNKSSNENITKKCKTLTAKEIKNNKIDEKYEKMEDSKVKIQKVTGNEDEEENIYARNLC